MVRYLSAGVVLAMVLWASVTVPAGAGDLIFDAGGAAGLFCKVESKGVCVMARTDEDCAKLGGVKVDSCMKSAGAEKDRTYLFVNSAASGSFKDGTLTLKGVPNIVYFSDRPERKAGHMSLEDFTALWKKNADDFKADPPNATLSIMGNDSDKIVVELMDAKSDGDSVTYSVKVLQGQVPETFGNSSLFIDGLSGAIAWVDE